MGRWYSTYVPLSRDRRRLSERGRRELTGTPGPPGSSGSGPRALPVKPALVVTSTTHERSPAPARSRAWRRSFNWMPTSSGAATGTAASIPFSPATSWRCVVTPGAPAPRRGRRGQAGPSQVAVSPIAGRGPGTGRRNTVSSKRSLRSTDAVGLVGHELEPVDRHALQGPSAALDAHVRRRDVPAPVVDGHAERFALSRHGDGGEHDDEPRIAQAVVDPAGAEHGVLHLGDQRVVGAVERLVAVREGDVQQHAAGVDEVRSPCRRDRRDRRSGTSRSTSVATSAGGPHGCVGAQAAMSSSLVGVIVARWKRAIDERP